MRKFRIAGSACACRPVHRHLPVASSVTVAALDAAFGLCTASEHVASDKSQRRERGKFKQGESRYDAIPRLKTEDPMMRGRGRRDRRGSGRGTRI
ncbi:hypothetical protein HN011_009497 [Eciton burchellii]|nr:hypothetical protein HN011_009497 [Eciton burchellii]